MPSMNKSTSILSQFGILDCLNAIRELQGLPKVTDWDFYFAEEQRKQDEMDAAFRSYMEAKKQEGEIMASVSF